MATQTQTLRRHPVNPSRTHDYLYDNHYVLSSERDHARATFKAHTGASCVKRVPVYQTMFSELRHHPRFQMRLDYTDPVPKFVARQWRGYADQQREALIRHVTINYDPSISVPPQHFSDAEVGGRNRYKYFKRPIIPFLQQVPPEVLLATARQDPLANAEQLAAKRPLTPLTKTVETQTDYRDSEAQTEPYTPEYVVRPGSAPELLTLATLSFGRGLPAGLAEVEMIERARAKRAWEKTLPHINDLTQVAKRQRMMEEMEYNEWALREQEIEKLQDARLEVLKQLLKQREENHQELNINRLDKLWSKKERDKERKLKKLRLEHIKIIRKLTAKRSNVEGKLQRKNIIEQYQNPASQVYAPLTRIGVFLDRGSEQYVVKSRFLNSYQGLLELEASLPDFVLNPRIKAPKPKTVTKAGFIKRKFRQDRELMELYEGIKEAKSKGEEAAKPLRFLKKIEKPIPRPPTPSIETPSWEDENWEMAVIFLQQVIRGRSIQNMMFEGKEKRMELIQELRSTHALQEAQQLEKKLEMQTTLALQRQRRLHEHRESLVDESLSHLEGQSLGDTLDYLSKELIRLQEERRIHAFSMLAERQRRIREAEESGHRQVEERRRREEDEIFKQLMSVHQVSVDTYLEDIILASVDRTADLQAREEIEQMAIRINDAAYDAEDKRTTLQSEEIVADLVHCFLLPEAQKRTIREKVQRSQRRFLLAAHKQVHKEGEAIIAMNAVEVKPDISEASESSAHPTCFAYSEETLASVGSSDLLPDVTETRKADATPQDNLPSEGEQKATAPSTPPPEVAGEKREEEEEEKKEQEEENKEEEKMEMKEEEKEEVVETKEEETEEEEEKKEKEMKEEEKVEMKEEEENKEEEMKEEEEKKEEETKEEEEKKEEEKVEMKEEEENKEEETKEEEEKEEEENKEEEKVEMKEEEEEKEEVVEAKEEETKEEETKKEEEGATEVSAVEKEEEQTWE